MSADIIQFIPKANPNPKRDSERTYQAMAQMFWKPWFAAAEMWQVTDDSSPCEVNPQPYLAPDKDPA